MVARMNQRPDQRDLREEQKLVNHPLHTREQGNISSFLRALRAAATPADLNRLHRDLFGRFLGAQRFLESLKAEKASARLAIRESRDRSDQLELRRLSTEIANLDADRRAANAVLSIQRQLGDALAWTLLDFRRSAATVLGEGERVDRLAGAAGLEAELALIDELTAQGVAAIHTDITSCLQHGDVLALRSLDPRLYELTEVKAGGAEDPAQMERLERATALLNDGLHPTAAQGGPLTIVAGPVPYRSHVEAAAAAIDQAREHSIVSLELEPGLGVQVYDETNPARLGRQDFEEREATFLARLGADEGDRIIYSVSVRRRRDRRHSFASLAPLSLLPYPVETTTALMVGGLDIITTIDAAALERRFSEHGIDAEVARGPEVEHGFLTARRGTASLTVPATVREQISIELMTIDTLIETVDWTLAQVATQGPGEQPQMIIDYADERAYWTTYRS
jgi:hypothetical protein